MALAKKIYRVSGINCLAPSPPEKRDVHYIEMFNFTFAAAC